jgi:hypothetical protein
VSLINLCNAANISLYSLELFEGVSRYIASTPETRSICNDPFIVGLKYTEALKSACSRTLSALTALSAIELKEEETSVLHILRGGLNFGLREALGTAYNWNQHASNFISAQRARKLPDSEDWIITENSYNKFHLKKTNQIVFGDVVATGTSLEYALKRVLENAQASKAEIRTVIFFSIGGPRSHEILANLAKEAKSICPAFERAIVVYFEGIFGVAHKDSKLSISITGTDLLRSPAILAPEFVEANYSNPSFPIERCAIYDAGSRAFDLDQYFFDIRDYWTKVLELYSKGMNYRDLLIQRFPELSLNRFADVNLKEICDKQLAKIPVIDNCLSVLSEH